MQMSRFINSRLPLGVVFQMMSVEEVSSIPSPHPKSDLAQRFKPAEQLGAHGWLGR